MTQLIIRPAIASDASALGRVHVQVWREAYAGIIPQSYLDNLSAEEREQRWGSVIAKGAPQTRFLTAWQGNDLLGFSGCGPARDPSPGTAGELYMINIVRAAHGLSLGRALVTRIARALHGFGFADMGLWVFLANTKARGFYRRLGGSECVHVKDVAFDGVALKECAVVWRDLASLIGSGEHDAL